MLPKIEIRTFGTLQVVRNHHAVTESDWHTRQARQLLKILITERPRPVSTDRLIEILWPNSTPSAAATTLRSAINALRNVLEPERPNRAPSNYIITQSPGYAFHLHADIWLDVEEYEHQLDIAHQVNDPRLRQQHLERATALYKDDYLISDPYADWVQNERERLRERYFNALLELSDLQASAGNLADAIVACRRILARDEVRENAYQLLMRFQAESGDSASALLTYERCRTILAEELGADPSPLTQSLHQRILNGEIQAVNTESVMHAAHVTGKGSLARPSGSGSGSSPLPQSTLLPAVDERYNALFVGREQEVSDLTAKLARALDGQGELLVLEGEAGVGKTRLAYAILQQGVDSGATVISATCQTLEQKFPFAPLADSIGRYLHSLPSAALQNLPHGILGLLGQIIPSMSDLVPELLVHTPDTSGNLDENRQRLIDGIVAFLAELSALRPLILFLDDLHWADQETLAVLSRLSQRVADLPIFLLLAYRSDDVVDNDALVSLLYTFNRAHQHHLIEVGRLNLEQVHKLIDAFTGQQAGASEELAYFLYEATQGNALFVTEALRDLRERFQAAEELSREEFTDHWSSKYQQVLTLRSNQRVQEIILERVERLPDDARQVLQLGAVIGRDFSLDLLEAASQSDPLHPLETLLQRQLLIERPDERIDYSHQVVRQAVYDSMNSLQRRRFHKRIADALVHLEQTHRNPAEVAFHFGQAGASSQLDFARYSVLAGEKLLQSFGLRQSIEQFDNALSILEGSSAEMSDMVGRALQGRGLAYESLLDPDGVTETYRRLQNWARRQGDLALLLTVHSRLAFMLELVGQQRESNELLRDLIDAFAANNVRVRSVAIDDLLERRRSIYSPYETGLANAWAPFVPPPPVPNDLVKDILTALEPVHAVLPLMTYGWTLRVQGQLSSATLCLTKAVELALETGQRSLASIAYFQLAVMARMQGRLEESQLLNEQSLALNRTGENSAAELVSMWPRIASAFQSLHAGRLEEAERRLQRVVDFLDSGDSFRNHRNSADIGLGIVALGYGDLATAKHKIEMALADPVHLYPYTHVQGLLGLAEIAAREGDPVHCRTLLRQALRFAGQRSLIEEYVEVVLEIARLNPEGAPVELLLTSALQHVEEAGMAPTATQLRDALETAGLTIGPIPDAKNGTAPGYASLPSSARS